MDFDYKENKSVIMVVCFVVFLLAVLLFSFWSSPTATPIQNDPFHFSGSEHDKSSHPPSPEPTPSQGYSSPGHPGQSGSGLPGGSTGSFFGGSTYSVETVEKQFASKQAETDFYEMVNEILQNREEVMDESRKWAFSRVNDESLTAQTRERYRLHLIPGLRNGHDLLAQGSYLEAMEEYTKALHDPNASPVSRYLTIDYMKHAASRLNDMDAYFRIWRIQALIVEESDLSLLGIDRQENTVEWVEEMIQYMQAANDPALFQQIVNRKFEQSRELDLDEDPAVVRAKIEEDTKDTIKQLTRGFYEN